MHHQGQLASQSYRFLAVVLSLLLVAPICKAQNATEETVPVITHWLEMEGNPAYVIAIPPQEKMPLRRLDIPIVSSRKPVTPVNEAELQLPFAMSAAQAVGIGRGLIGDEEFQLALLYFQEAQKQQPNSLDVLIGLGQSLYELKRDDEALAVYKEVVAQNDGLWQVHFNVGRIHLENRRYAEAVQALTKAYQLKPSSPDVISGLGIALTKNGQSAEAIPHLTVVAGLKRYIPEDFYNLGEAYANERQWLKAAEAFKNGADIRGIDANGYHYWATMFFNADKIDEAFEGYREKVKKIDYNQTHADSSVYLAEIYRLRGKPIEALGQYQIVLRLRPNDIESLFQAGYLSFKLDQLGGAKDYFKRLMQIDPKHAGAAASLAALEAQHNENRKRLQQATPGITLREVAQANPTSAEAHINLGAQLITERVFSEAVTVLEKAVSLKPASAAAHYNLGLAQLKTGQFERAVVSIRKALELKPKWPEAYNNLGLAYANLNKWAEAANAHREAVSSAPQQYAGAYHNLGQAYVKLGQVDAAKEIQEKLRQPATWNLQASLGQAILTTQNPAYVGAPAAAAPTPSTVLPTPTENSSPSPGKENENTLPPTAEEECPEPIYRRASVTRMPLLIGQPRVPYTAEALQNKVEGKIVLQAVLCGNGRVSDVTVDERLPFGLTERAVEVMRKIQFQPALRDDKPVSVMFRQTFVCAGSECTATIEP